MGVVRNKPEYPAPDDTRLARLAGRQHGVVGRRQLQAMGYTRHAIHSRLATGRLHRLHRGVYAVGHTRLTARGRWMAAVLACGPQAALSHRAAAALHGLRAVGSGAVDVTATRKHRQAGIRCHQVRRLDPRDITVVDGIPVTTVERTLLDLAETLNPRRLRETLEQTQRERKLSWGRIDALIARSLGRHGIAPLNAALALLRDEPPVVRSPLEVRFLSLVREAGLPEPLTNAMVDGIEVDFFWPAHNAVVQLDGWKFHRSKRTWEEDRAKDARLVIAGRRVVRFTHDRVNGHPAAVVAEVSALLPDEPWPPRARSGP